MDRPKSPPLGSPDVKPIGLVERLFSQHGNALQVFFRRRIKAEREAEDLTQEVYLRMLRMNEAETINNPEAYLFTVASHLLKEHVVVQRRQEHTVDIADPRVAEELSELPQLESDADLSVRIRRLHEVLGQLSPKCQASVAMAYWQGMSYEDIAVQLGISRNMVKKYLVQALAHCRKRFARLG
jgi:RNA polymerase sigma factor (sigma-70 family)